MLQVISVHVLTFLNSQWRIQGGGGGVRGVQMHPPLAASNVFLRT